MQIKGRAPIYKEPMRLITLMIDSENLIKARKIGNGNVSAGIRKAIEMMESSKRQK